MRAKHLIAGVHLRAFCGEIEEVQDGRCNDLLEDTVVGGTLEEIIDSLTAAFALGKNIEPAP